jgi:hypothetical protein
MLFGARCECSQKLRQLAERNWVRLLGNGLWTKLQLSAGPRGRHQFMNTFQIGGFTCSKQFLAPARSFFLVRQVPRLHATAWGRDTLVTERCARRSVRIPRRYKHRIQLYLHQRSWPMWQSCAVSVVSPRVRVSPPPRCSIEGRDLEACLEGTTRLPSLPRLSQLQNHAQASAHARMEGRRDGKLGTSERVDRVPALGPRSYERLRAEAEGLKRIELLEEAVVRDCCDPTVHHSPDNCKSFAMDMADEARCKRIVNKLLQDRTLKELFGVPGFVCPSPRNEVATNAVVCSRC